MKMIYKLSFPVTLLFLLSACSAVKKISLKNLNYLYRENTASHLVAKAQRINDTSYILHLGTLQHEPSNFQFTQNDGFVVDYSVYGQQKNEPYFTRDSIRLKNAAFPKETENFEFALPAKGKYLVNIQTEDAAGRLYASLVLLRNSANSADNYLARDTTEQAVLFPFLDRPQLLTIETTLNDPKELLVYYYNRQFPPARPPFIFNKAEPYLFEPDSIFKLAKQERKGTILNIDKKGYYHILADTNQREGYTLFLYDNGFPRIISAKDMLTPLRYISSDEEFEKMRNSSDVRLSIEEFWLKLKGNIERARFAIRRYYSRVEDANILFSSYLPGWKSDRGMIYIVYGEPSSVSHGNDYEIWTYGEPESPNALRFEFIKLDNPFTDKDYQLVRSPNFKESWYFNIDNWRR